MLLTPNQNAYVQTLKQMIKKRPQKTVLPPKVRFLNFKLFLNNHSTRLIL